MTNLEPDEPVREPVDPELSRESLPLSASASGQELAPGEDRGQLDPDWAELVLDKADPEEQNFENFDYSALNTLGTRAIALGLLIGHGYHQGQYELLLAATSTHPVTPLLLSPRQAYGYLKALLDGETTHG